MCILTAATSPTSTLDPKELAETEYTETSLPSTSLTETQSQRNEPNSVKITKTVGAVTSNCITEEKQVSVSFEDFSTDSLHSFASDKIHSIKIGSEKFVLLSEKMYSSLCEKINLKSSLQEEIQMVRRKL